MAKAQTQYLISTYAGGLPGQTAAQATSYGIPGSTAIAADQFGNVYVSTTSCVFRRDSAGVIVRVAGTCQAGYSGDGQLAVNAQLNNPQGLAVDGAGNLFIADQNNQRIRQVSPSGIITTIAGTGVAGYSPDGLPGTSTLLNSPQGLAVDPAGNLYIADSRNNLVRKLAAGGAVVTIAGTHAFGTTGDGGPATAAKVGGPVALALDSAGNLYIGDASNQVRKIDTGGIITHFAGTTEVSGDEGDSGPASAAQLTNPAGLAVDAAGNVYIADEYNQVIRKVNPSGIISTYAGGGLSVANGVAALNARLSTPVGVAVDYNGNLYVATQSPRVPVIDSNAIVNTAIGTGAPPFSGDGGPAALAQFTGPWGMALDASHNLYIADSGNYRVRKIPLTGANAGTVSTFAGNGSGIDSGDGNPATAAGVTPLVVAVDPLGNVYLGDFARIRKIVADGTISTIAGTGTAGYSGDNFAATSATLSASIAGLAADSSGNLYISDTNNSCIRMVTPAGIISTIAGTGTAGYNGDGPATTAQLSYPAGLALDAAGKNLYIADSGNLRVRKLSLGANGALVTVAGNGGLGNSGDGAAATSAQLTNPWGVALDSSGNLFIATEQNTVRMVSALGVISTIAGTGQAGSAGDGGPGSSAQLNYPLSVAVDSTGNVYVSDYKNNTVRILEPVGTEPLLTVSSTHTGTFSTGQPNAAFSLLVTNAAQSAPTGGSVTVTDTLPPGLTLVTMTGSGWNCSGTVCTSIATSLPAGTAFQPIGVVVSVASGAQPQVTNVVTTSGGGAPGVASEDVVFVGPPNPALQISSTHSGNFVVGQQATYTIVVQNLQSAAATTGPATVTETLPGGLTLVSLDGGPNWSCSGNTCSRSDPLAGGAGYDPITVTIKVPANTPPGTVTNHVTVSGGGSADASSDDPTVIIPVTCNVTGDQTASVADVQAMVNQTLGLVPPRNDLTSDGLVTVADIQLVINAALNKGCSL